MTPLYSNVYHNIILSFSFHLIVPDCSCYQNHQYKYIDPCCSDPVYHLGDGQCYKSVPERQSVGFILTFLLFTLFLSLLMLFEDCQPSDPPDTLAQYLHLRAYHGKEFYFYTYPDWEVDINKRISQLIPSQCRSQIREIRN